MKAVLKMNAVRGSTLELNVTVNLHEGKFKSRVDEDGSFVGVGDTVIGSVDDLASQLSNTVASSFGGATMPNKR